MVEISTSSQPLFQPLFLIGELLLLPITNQASIYAASLHSLFVRLPSFSCLLSKCFWSASQLSTWLAMTLASFYQACYFLIPLRLGGSLPVPDPHRLHFKIQIINQLTPESVAQPLFSDTRSELICLLFSCSTGQIRTMSEVRSVSCVLLLGPHPYRWY